MDEKHEAFKQSVNSGGLVTSGSTSNWQKSKITKDDGKITQITGFDFNNPEQRVGDSTQFIYVSQAINYPRGVSTNGIVEYLVVTSDYKRMTYRPNGTNKVFVKRKEAGSWSDWSELALMITIRLLKLFKTRNQKLIRLKATPNYTQMTSLIKDIQLFLMGRQMALAQHYILMKV